MSDTTLAALQKALTKQDGMRRIPLTLESYRHQSVPLSSKLLMNTFAEQEPADARVAAALLPTPGLVEIFTAGTGPISIVDDNRPGTIFFISGTHLWKAVTDGVAWTTTDLGDVGTPSGAQPQNLFYSLAVGVNAVSVCSPPRVFVWTEDGTSDGLLEELNQPDHPTDPVLPYTASSVTYLDGYFVYTAQSDPTLFFVSRLLDPTAIDALDFAALDAFPNAIFKVLTVGRDLWFAGATGWEIWYDAGNQDFPFRRKPDGIIQRPVIAPKACIAGDERVYWWSGNNCAYRSVGYQEERISTHAVEYQLRGLGPQIDSAFIYHLYGHTYYVINTTDQTLAYDQTTKVWHNVSSTTDGSGPWRPLCATQNLAVPVFGDRATGRVMSTYQGASDMGVNVQRRIVLPPLYAGTKRAFCARLEVELEVGANTPGSVFLDWSDDGGITYVGGRSLSAGTTSETRKRVYTTRLGSFRNRVFRLTANAPMTVYAVDADIVAGNH